MRIRPLFLLFPFLAFAQNTLPTFDGVVNPDEWSSAEKHAIEYEISPGNAQNTLPAFDGVVNPDEWSSAEKHAIEYEISPGNNTPSPINCIFDEI